MIDQEVLKKMREQYEKAKALAKKAWEDGDHEGTPNDFYYFQCGFAAGLNYQRLQALNKLSQLDQEMD